MALTTYRCPECGHEIRAIAGAVAVTHRCNSVSGERRLKEVAR